MNRVVQFLGLEAAPDFREVNNDIAGLSPRFTKDFEAQKKQLGKRLKAQKNEKATAKEELYAALRGVGLLLLRDRSPMRVAFPVRGSTGVVRANGRPHVVNYNNAPEAWWSNSFSSSFS